MEVTIRVAELQSNSHHQQTNTQLFYRPDARPVAQPTVSKHPLCYNNNTKTTLGRAHYASDEITQIMDPDPGSLWSS